MIYSECDVCNITLSHDYARRPDMISIDLRSRTPIYEQVKNQITELIRIGVFKSDDRLPSIRAVAAGAGLNVNTIKRAFAELESDGVIYTIVGSGSFVSKDALGGAELRRKAVDEVTAAVRTARMKGIEKNEIIKIAEKIYCEESANGRD
jgi:GntR family transcriptional regulator